MSDTILKDGTIVRDPRLDRLKQFDERSRDFPIRSAIGSVERVEKMWTPGDVLDQGNEGACVGFAWSGELSASPYRVDDITDATAMAVYKRAQQIDEWPGEAYSGTSVLAGAKATVETGLIEEYRWAFGADDVIDTVIAHGPVILGIDWYSGMYETTLDTDGQRPVVKVGGTKVGGHAILCIGYNPRARINLEGWGWNEYAEVVYLRNSWGPNWGNGGTAAMLVTDLRQLLADGGEACVPMTRKKG